MLFGRKEMMLFACPFRPALRCLFLEHLTEVVERSLCGCALLDSEFFFL